MTVPKTREVPYYLAKERIEFIRLSNGVLTLAFDDASVMQFPAKRIVYKFGSGEITTGQPDVPTRLLTKGNKLMDGKLRCGDCNCLLTADNRLCNFCRTCAQFLPVFVIPRDGLKFCQVPNSDEKVLAYLSEQDNDTDLTKLNADDVLMKVLDIYRKELKEVNIEALET